MYWIKFSFLSNQHLKDWFDSESQPVFEIIYNFRLESTIGDIFSEINNRPLVMEFVGLNLRLYLKSDKIENMDFVSINNFEIMSDTKILTFSCRFLTFKRKEKIQFFFWCWRLIFFYCFKTFPFWSLHFCKSRIYDRATGLWAFEVQMPFQKYPSPPILVNIWTIILINEMQNKQEQV